MARQVIKILHGQLCGRESPGVMIAGYQSPGPNLGGRSGKPSQNVAAMAAS